MDADCTLYTCTRIARRAQAIGREPGFVSIVVPCSSGGHHGATRMETARLADRQDRTAQGQSEIQAALARTLDRRRGEESQGAGQAEYADRGIESEAEAAAGRHPQQGATRRDLAEAGQPLPIQSQEDEAVEHFAAKAR